LQCVAADIVLQCGNCVAVHVAVHVAVCCSGCRVAVFVAVRCSAATCCRVLQCVAVDRCFVFRGHLFLVQHLLIHFRIKKILSCCEIVETIFFLFFLKSGIDEFQI